MDRKKPVFQALASNSNKRLSMNSQSEPHPSQGFNMIGGSLCWVKTLDHPSSTPSAADHGALLCGAVAIGIGVDVIVLRSPLRYRWLNRAVSMREIDLAAPMMVNRYELDQWEWIMGNIADDPLSRTGVAAWRLYPDIRPAMVTQFVCCGNAFYLQLDSNESLHIRLRPDLDATLVVTRQPDMSPSPGAVVISEPRHLYGWLRPDGTYRVFWNSLSWINVDAAWRWGRLQLAPPQSQSLFKIIYQQMLEQHPELQRRLAAIEQPILWTERPEIGMLIDEVRQETRRSRANGKEIEGLFPGCLRYTVNFGTHPIVGKA